MGNITLTLTFAHRHVYIRGKQLLAHRSPSWRMSPVHSGVDAPLYSSTFSDHLCVAPGSCPGILASWLPVCFCYDYLTCLLNC